MTDFKQWAPTTPNNTLAHEDAFRSMEWLKWQQTPEGGLVSRPIVIGGAGSPAWVKSKLARLGVDAKIIPVKCENLNGMEAAAVSISIFELDKLRQSPDSDHDLLKTLKLNSQSRSL